MEAFTTIVLAGGGSTRMGRPKPLLPFGDETLIERVVRRLAGQSSEVVVVGGPHLQLPRLPESIRVVEDEIPLQGPLAGIAYGLQAARSDLSFVCGCDHPFLDPAIGRLLADRVRDGDGAVVLSGGVPQPLLAVYRKRVATIAAAMLASGERRAARLVERARLVEVCDEDVLAVDPSGLSLVDIDTPLAYREALARLNPGAR
jgi:molybdopterin-guanine dinucleotide biosynthesis protein A